MTKRLLLYIIALTSSFAGCAPNQPEKEQRPVFINTPIEPKEHSIFDFDDFKEEEAVLDTLPNYETLGFPIKYLAIHCTASPPSNPMREIVRLSWWKRNRGWNRWGYHVIFFRNGDISVLNPQFKLDPVMQKAEIVNGVLGLNKHTISIAYVGGISQKKYNGKRIPEDNMTEEQFYAMRGFIQAVQVAIPEVKIGGHRDFLELKNKPMKACPSFDVADKFGDIIKENNSIQN